jgi:hypothetical protein
MHGVTVLALGHGVVLGKLDPMIPLVRRQNAAAFAQWAYAVERREDRCPNKLRSIGDSSHRPPEWLVRLEANDFLLSLVVRHGTCLPVIDTKPSINTLYYHI